MKNSNVLASLFFGSLAAAVPFSKRDKHTLTSTVVETQVVWTTVWADEVPTVEATTSAGQFYEQPSSVLSSQVPAIPTSTYVAPVAPTTSSVYVAPASSSVYVAPTSIAAPQPQSTTSVYTPPAVSSYQAPAAPSSVYTPSPVSSAPAAASSASTGSTGTGETYKNADLTVYDGGGAAGACSVGGEAVDDSAYTVALTYKMMGDSTYDKMTGAPTNPWCGKKISITYGGKTIEATITDRCAGCEGATDIDLTRAAIKAVTGSDASERYHGASWSVIG